jgi:hypothetical protein
MVELVIISTLQPYCTTTTLLGALILALPLWITYNLFFSPLASIPGPWTARAGVSLLKARSASNTTWVWDLERLHKRYGPIVRVSTNHLSISDPNALASIYRIANPLHKTEFYHVFQAVPGKPSLFSDTDFESHKIRKKAVAPAYAMTFLTNLEECVEGVVLSLKERMREILENGNGNNAGMNLGVEKGRGVDVEFDKMAHYFAMDAVGELAVSISLESQQPSLSLCFVQLTFISLPLFLLSSEKASTSSPPTPSIPSNRPYNPTGSYEE